MTPGLKPFTVLPIHCQIKPCVAFGLPYLLIELFYIGMPVVRTDGRAGGRSEYGHVINKFSQMGNLPHFFTHGAPLRALRTRELRYKGRFGIYLRRNEKAMHSKVGG